YLALPGERSLYNVQALHERHKAIALVEGEVDAMVVDTYVLPAVGVPGARHWKKWWRRMFEDYEKVFVVGDGDKAGEEFAESVGGKLGNASVVVFPEGEDANSILLSGGERKLNELILGNG